MGHEEEEATRRRSGRSPDAAPRWDDRLDLGPVHGRVFQRAVPDRLWVGARGRHDGETKVFHFFFSKSGFFFSTKEKTSHFFFFLSKLFLQQVAKKLPAAAYVATLAFRFANNVIGGENFIDMARWTGIQ